MRNFCIFLLKKNICLKSGFFYLKIFLKFQTCLELLKLPWIVWDFQNLKIAVKYLVYYLDTFSYIWFACVNMDWFFSYLPSQVIIIQLIYHEKDLQELAVGEQQINLHHKSSWVDGRFTAGVNSSVVVDWVMFLFKQRASFNA